MYNLQGLLRKNVVNTEKLPIVVLGIKDARKLPITVKNNTAANITNPFFISSFLFLPYVYAEMAEANTSEASAMPTAS